MLRAGFGSQDLRTKKEKEILKAGYGSKDSSIKDFRLKIYF